MESGRVLRCQVVISLLMFCGLFTLAGATLPPSQWRVISSGQLDSRIQRQLERLAVEQNASIRFDHKIPENKLVPSKPGSLVIHLELAIHRQDFVNELTSGTAGSPVPLSEELVDEGYILRTEFSAIGSIREISVHATSTKGFHNALLRVPDLFAIPASRLEAELIPRPQSTHWDNYRTRFVIADFPSFAIRGVVEGFYGPPWSHADRLDILSFEGRHGMNLYLYGPKDDPYHRKLWRESYPPDQLKRLGELANAAHENFVDFSFALSPGLSMTYSDDADFNILVRKLDSIRKLGVTNFALFLDDVPQEMVHSEDRARFHSLAQAHIKLVHRVYDYLHSLSADYHLTVCPTTYTNAWGSRDYIEELGAGLRPEILIDWTGTQVIPPTITAEQAREWGKVLHRKPLVWDNYPTDDGNNALPNIEPLRGRDPQLFSSVAGLFSNPMNQAHLTQIPLETIADYLWNPVAYSPELSERHAFQSQYGPLMTGKLEPLLALFAAGGESRSILQSMFEESWEPVDLPGIQTRIASLRSVIASMQSQEGLASAVRELMAIADALSEQVAKISNNSAFKQLPDGKIQWDRHRDELTSFRVNVAPTFDGDFSKWESHSLIQLNGPSQISEGRELWNGPSQFSTRVALAWDSEHLYFGIDVTDPQIYQPFFGRGVENGDSARIVLNTQSPATTEHGRLPSVFDIYFSPGNFAAVKPSIYCDEDLFPPRPLAHDLSREIKAVWKKTPAGFSGDIVIPVTFFNRPNFANGEKIALSFDLRKVFAPLDPLVDDPERIVFSSKGSSVFAIDQENPATLQSMELLEP